MHAPVRRGQWDCPSGRTQPAGRQARSVPPYRPPASARHIISARCPLPSACPPQSTLRRRVAQRRPTLLPVFAPPHRTEPEAEPSPEPGASTAFCISPWHDVMGLPVGWWNSEMPPAGGGCPLGRKVQVGTGTWLLREGGDHAHVPRPTSHVRCRIECSNQGSGSLVPASPNRAMATSPKIQSSTSTRSFL